jgi:hypothetical protein
MGPQRRRALPSTGDPDWGHQQNLSLTFVFARPDINAEIGLFFGKLEINNLVV